LEKRKDPWLRHPIAYYLGKAKGGRGVSRRLFLNEKEGKTYEGSEFLNKTRGEKAAQEAGKKKRKKTYGSGVQMCLHW